MARSENKKLHIAMFPWLAFGHMMPYLELAKLIAQKGHKISFISTPKNIDRLPKPPPNLSPFISFVKLPLPHVENLPPAAEATSDLPLEDVWHLKKAYDLLQEPLSRFLESSLPDWIVFDFAPYWVPAVAGRLNISTVFFSIFIAAAVCYFSPGYEREDNRKIPEDYTVAPEWIPLPSNNAFRLFEVLRIFEGLTGNDDNTSDLYRFHQGLLACDLIAVRSSWEVEPEWFKLIEELHRKPVFPVGVLPSSLTADGEENETWKSMKQWLDGKDKGSVLYVAFGSEAKPSQEELTEIALGLELSRIPFLWVVRMRRGLADSEVLEFPDGFEERTKGCGWVCTSWAPQVKILVHDSVGGFLTHSGWSSVVEALQFSRALVLLTFLADQGINAKVLEAKKMGYLIPRSEDDGSFTREAVAKSVRLVMVEEAGKVYRDKAKEMSAVLGDKNKQQHYVDCLLKCLEAREVVKKGECGECESALLIKELQFV